MHIIHAPGIWFLCADLSVLAVAVIVIHGILIQLLRIISKVIGGLRSGAADIFPFRLCGEPVKFSRDNRKPLAEAKSAIWRNIYHWETFPAHTHAGILKGRRGAAHRIHNFFLFVGKIFKKRIVFSEVQFKNIPRNFHSPNPEAVDRYPVLRSFVRNALRFGFRTSHQEFAGGSKGHFKRDFRTRNSLCVSSRRLLVLTKSV